MAEQLRFGVVGAGMMGREHIRNLKLFDDARVVSRDWGGYPILTFPEVPDIDVLLVPRPDDPPLGGGESASVPSAAAIAPIPFLTE